MNPKKEFVNAIMSVLRLEKNIYTVGAIEEIIDRIDTSDYTIFIAYLGERDSDFERPIQTIAKATEDFYEKKNKPKRFAILEIVEQIVTLFRNSNHRAVEEYKIKKLNDEGIWEGRYTVSGKQVKKYMLDIEPKEDMPDFEVEGKMLPYSSLKPLINKCGGITKLVDLYLKDMNDFKDLLLENSGVKKYQKLNILDKIHRDSKKDINKNVLGIINNKLIPSKVIW